MICELYKDIFLICRLIDRNFLIKCFGKKDVLLYHDYIITSVEFISYQEIKDNLKNIITRKDIVVFGDETGTLSLIKIDYVINSKKQSQDFSNLNINKLFLNNNNNEINLNEKIKTPNLIAPTFINRENYSELDKGLFRSNSKEHNLNLNINRKESYNYNFFQPLFLPDDFQRTEQYNPENKNEPKNQDYGGMPRPESNITLCNERKPSEDVFLKPEELDSIDEGKNMNQNFFVNENYIINMPINYNIFLGNPTNLLNGNKTLNFNFDWTN